MVRFIQGILFTVALVIGAAYVGIRMGMMPAGADAPKFPLERWAANQSLRATIARDTQGLTSPVAPTDDNLIAGIKAYGEQCSVCHGASDAQPSDIARGFYIRAPQLAKDGVEDDPETMTYWRITHGIRFTGMPAFEKTLDDTTRWQIAAFVARMDKLPPPADAEWKRLPSVAPSASPLPLALDPRR